jgi:chromosome segregation protein
VNLRADEESEELDTERTRLKTERDDLIEAVARLRKAVDTLSREGRARLLDAFEIVDGHFRTLFATLFDGGRAELALTESDDPLEAGLEIYACPPGKKMETMSLMSGGEQALTATALIFAVFLANPAPVCVLDEVDAPLDDANVDRYCTMLEQMRAMTETRFPGDHAQSRHHEPDGPLVRRHHGRARRLAAGQRESEHRRGDARSRIVGFYL